MKQHAEAPTQKKLGPAMICPIAAGYHPAAVDLPSTCLPCGQTGIGGGQCGRLTCYFWVKGRLCSLFPGFGLEPPRLNPTARRLEGTESHPNLGGSYPGDRVGIGTGSAPAASPPLGLSFSRCQITKLVETNTELNIHYEHIGSMPVRTA